MLKLICLYALFPLFLLPAGEVEIVEKWTVGAQGDSLFIHPMAIDISPENVIYVADAAANRIVILSTEGRVLHTIGGFGFEAEQFDEPRDIWARSITDIFVADYNNRRLQRFDRQMNYLSSLENNEGLDESLQFDYVAGCVVTGQNDLFLLSRDQDKIIKFNREGDAEYAFGMLESTAAELNRPGQIDLWQGHILLVSNSGDSSLVLFDLFGNPMGHLRHPQMIRPYGLTVINDVYFLVSDPAAGKLFLFDGNKQCRPLVIPELRHPRDAAVLYDSGASKWWIFILDGQRLIKGTLTLP